MGVHRHYAVAPHKPFSVYYAPGVTHAPHHPRKEWVEKYKGKFNQGWDQVREETLARQKRLGIFPASADLTTRSEGIPSQGDHRAAADGGGDGVGAQKEPARSGRCKGIRGLRVLVEST